MLNGNRTIGFAILFLFAIGVPNPSLAQESLILDTEISESLPTFGNVLQYSVILTKGTFFEAILDFDIAERDFYAEMILFNSTTGEEVWRNQSMNFPNFLGVYILAEIPATQKYTLQVLAAEDLNRRIDFTLTAHVYNGDEPNGRAIYTYDVLDGVIGPQREADIYNVSLRQGSPVLFVVTTPHNILDSIIGILDSASEVVAYNNDFFGTGSTLLYIPDRTGNYQVLVQGNYIESIGPYRLIMNPAPLKSAPFLDDGEIDVAGEMEIVQVSLKSNEVYDFLAYAVDDFYPILALADSEMNAIASSRATEDFPAAAIDGFTPLHDETLYLFVMGDTTDATGYYGLETSLRADEEDGIVLEHGDVFQGVIGPIGDVDEYTFSAAEGMDYSILITPTQHNLDPAVRVLDADGNELFFNDDSTDGVFSMLSGIVLPASAEYRIQVSASPAQNVPQFQTGVYLIQLATGATFDWGPPRIAEDWVTVTPTASGAHISIPTYAIGDDTYPLSATLAFDKGGEDVRFTIHKNEPVELDVNASPSDIFLLSMSDSAHRHNFVGPVVIPGPRILADLEGMPTALAVDRDNNLYITDSYIGGIVKYAIDGASETILQGELTQGGTLGPNALAFNADGDLYFANAATHSIAKVLPNGATETFASGLNFPVSFTFDKDGVMYLAQIGSDTIDKIYPDGSVEPFVSTIRNPNGLAFSPDGVLYVCNSALEDSGIFRANADGSAEMVFGPMGDSLSGLAFDRDGYLYVTTENQGILYRISPEDERLIFAQDIGAAAGLAFGRGEYETTLFVCSSFNYNDPYRNPYYYEQRLLAVPTGREGIPVPDNVTGIPAWMVY